MRIAIFAPVFVRPTETFIYDMASELASSDFDVEVVTAVRSLEVERPFDRVHVVPVPGRWSPRRLILRALRPVLRSPLAGDRTTLHQERLRRTLARLRPDVLFAHYGTSGVLVATAAASLNIPVVVSFHGADASRLARNPEWCRKYREMFQTVAAVTGPSEYVRKRLISLGCPEDRAHVLHNGVATDCIECAPPAVRYDQGEIRFIFVGRLAPKKDPLTLLKSFLAAKQQLAPLPASLTMIGDGPLRKEVEAMIERLELQEDVHLMGRQTHDEVIRQYRQAHIYVQHSVTSPDGDEEGLPVSITEALAAGLPVVSTRHSGIPEVVRNGVSGILVEEKDVDGMAAAMVDLARSPERWDELGRSGRHLLETEFDTQVVQKRLRSLLCDAASTGEPTV